MERSHADPLVSVSWLKDHAKSEDLIIVDCRWNLTDKNYGYNAYLKGHVPEAYFLDVEKDLSDLARKGEGRHPMPTKEYLERKLSGIGIKRDSTIIAYDDDAAGAARLWFDLRYYSFDRCYVLDGGFPAWKASGGLITREVPPRTAGNLELGPDRNDMIASLQEVENGIKRVYLIDARASERYLGQTEPIDPYPGHIPGARNLFWKLVLNNDLTYKSNQEVLDMLDKEDGKKPVLYCGSGITSCVPYLAIYRAGLEPKIFPGGWSQWSRAKQPQQ